MRLLSDRLRFIRFFTWWNYKLPPLFGIAYFFTILYDVPFHAAIQRYGILLLSMIGTAGFGHYLNDLSDIEADRLAGKANAAAGHSPAQRAGLIALLLSLSLVPWFVFLPAGLPHVFIGCVLLLFVFYSLPPFRLKDRAFAGVLADMLYAHGIPALIVAFAVIDKTGEGGEYLIALVCFWQVMVGLRNIAFHQVEDVDADKKAGAKTWATQLGVERVKKICLYLFHPLELISFAGIVFFLFQHSRLGGFLLLALIAWRLFICLFLYEKNYLASLRNYFSFVNNSNEEDFPLVMLVVLCCVNPWFAILLGLHLLFFPEYVFRMLKL